MKKSKQNSILSDLTDDEILVFTGVTKVCLNRAVYRFKHRHTAVKRLLKLNRPELYHKFFKVGSRSKKINTEVT